MRLNLKTYIKLVRNYKDRTYKFKNKIKQKRFLIYKKYLLEYMCENRTKVRGILNNIKSRCNNPNASHYEYYGGKGIKCLLSLNDLIHLWNRDRAYLMKFPSIDRLNSKGNYIHNNCRFVEMNTNRKRK